MKNNLTLQANEAAERIVRYIQAHGFAGISEALIIRINKKGGDRSEIDAAFEAAHDQEIPPPVQQYFEIRPIGHFSEFRSFDEARSTIQSDFTEALRMEIPRVFFDPAPVVIDDAMATDSKYDVLMKIADNIEGYAIGILLNDPDASFLEYIGTHHGDDWQKIMGDFQITTSSLASEIKLFWRIDQVDPRTSEQDYCRTTGLPAQEDFAPIEFNARKRPITTDSSLSQAARHFG
jgi:hypothetical protein